MVSTRLFGSGFAAMLLAVFALPARAQSFKVQCPTHTALHPLVAPTAENPTGANPGIKCQQLGGGDGFATMADGTQTYMFSFGPLSGLGNIVHGLPGTVSASEYNQSNVDPLNGPVDADGVLTAVKIGAPDGAAYTFNGAIGLVPDPAPGGALTGPVAPRLILDGGPTDTTFPPPLIAIDQGHLP